jgi:DNA-binding Xre family transcriptional regulator
MVDRAWSAAELSRVSGVYHRTLTEYLAGRKPIHDHHLAPIADALDVDIEDLVVGQ